MSAVKLHPAVYGIEHEYSHLLESPGSSNVERVGSCHSADVELGLYIEPDEVSAAKFNPLTLYLVSEALGLTRNRHGMLSNGGRLYVDLGNIEYCTPETTTAEEATVRSFDGDKIVLDMLGQFRENGLLENFQLNRRLLNHRGGASRGVHLNTCTTIKAETGTRYEEFRHRLATLNVVKGSMFGSGGLMVDEQGVTNFHHSPRLSVTDSVYSTKSAYTSRPLVREPFAPDVKGLRRVESVSGDALNFAWPLRASMVLTNAFIWLAELGHGNSLPIIDESQSVEMARRVGRYGNEQLVPVSTPRDERVRMVAPIDVIRAYAEETLTVDDSCDYLDDESRQVLPEIVDVADRMSVDMSSAAPYVESIFRWMTIQGKMADYRQPMGSERICRVDYAWDWLGDGRGYAESFRSNGRGWQGFTDESQKRSPSERLIPPQDTRAKVRGEFIEDSHGYDDSSWGAIGNQAGQKIKLHPLTYEAPPFMPTAKVTEKVAK